MDGGNDRQDQLLFLGNNDRDNQEHSNDDNDNELPQRKTELPQDQACLKIQLIT